MLSEEFEDFPESLRALVHEELAAGNTTVELSHGLPAAPHGAYVMLSQPITTRPHASTPELVFADRNTPGYSGTFTTPEQYYCVLEPPPAPRSRLQTWMPFGFA